jgi:hypothetical protein
MYLIILHTHSRMRVMLQQKLEEIMCFSVNVHMHRERN